MKFGKSSTSRPRVGYAFALLAVALATLTRLALDSWLGPEALPYFTFYAALTVIAFFFGRNPGLLATFVGGLACDYFITPPRHSSLFQSAFDTLPMAFYWATGILVSTMAGRLHATRRAAQQQADELRRSEEVVRRRAEELRSLMRERNALLESERTARGTAERAARAKDDFLALLSHELRTPLNAILGWSYVLQHGGFGADDFAEAHDAIDQSARLLKQLIEDLLDMSRLTSGKLKLTPEPIDIASLTREVVAMFHPEAQASGVTLEARSDHAQCEVLGDVTRLKQVVGNLLSNAVKFTPAGGRVRVHVGCAREHAVIAVKDTGIGIAPEFLPQLFQVFRQADSSSTRVHRGLGLGLALVKRLTELHGGSVQARSKGPGRGALFVVRLPVLSKRGRDHEAILKAQAAMDLNLGGLVLLVVDDEPHTLAFVTRVLSEAGAEVRACTCAAEALRALVQHRFDVLISDISMPGEDGYSLMRKVRQLSDRQCAGIPALAVTAYSRTADEQRALEAGFNRYLVKPVEAAELCAAAASLAGRTVSTAPAAS